MYRLASKQDIEPVSINFSLTLRGCNYKTNDFANLAICELITYENDIELLKPFPDCLNI